MGRRPAKVEETCRECGGAGTTSSLYSPGGYDRVMRYAETICRSCDGLGVKFTKSCGR